MQLSATCGLEHGTGKGNSIVLRPTEVFECRRRKEFLTKDNRAEWRGLRKKGSPFLSQTRRLYLRDFDARIQIHLLTRPFNTAASRFDIQKRVKSHKGRKKDVAGSGSVLCVSSDLGRK